MKRATITSFWACGHLTRAGLVELVDGGRLVHADVRDPWLSERSHRGVLVVWAHSYRSADEAARAVLGRLAQAKAELGEP